MKLAIRPACLEADSKVLIEAFMRFLNPHYDAPRFEWAYLQNPHGQGRAWIAFDPARDVLVGTATAFPRRARVGDRTVTGWVLGDFCVADGYRSLGPAVQLQRTCLAGVDSGAVSFCYDFPSVSMSAVYARLGVSQTLRRVRLARPLRVDRYVRDRIKHPGVARGVSTTVNLVLALTSRNAPRDATLDTTLHGGSCGDEFSALADEIGTTYGACIDRSAEYLNWRYLSNPFQRYEIMTARHVGVLRGYAVFTQTEEEARIVDLVGIEPDVVVRMLVEAVTALQTKRGACTLSLRLCETHPWLSLLRTCGFRPRESSTIVIYAGLPSPPESGSIERGPWFLMDGDADG
jgi:GNAT superfamily N-acetyltransferase